MPQADADVNTELNTLLSAKSSNVLEVLRRLSIVSSSVEGERMCLQVLGSFSLPDVGEIYYMIEKLVGARWKFGRQCVKLQVVLTLIEEFLDLGYLYVFKLYFVCHMFQSFLGLYLQTFPV